MINSNYDIIVAELAQWARACYFLSLSGAKVLGLEQFVQSPHDNGSHAGQSCIIRKAYFEHRIMFLAGKII